MRIACSRKVNLSCRHRDTQACSQLKAVLAWRQSIPPLKCGSACLNFWKVSGRDRNVRVRGAADERCWQGQSIGHDKSTYAGQDGSTPCARPSKPCFGHLCVARPSPGAEPIRVVFPLAAGGSGDVLVRLLAEHLRITLDLPVRVENRP